MKITPTDKPNTTQVSDTDGKDDDSINEDEIEWNIQHIEKMDQEPTQWIWKQNIQQIYHEVFCMQVAQNIAKKTTVCPFYVCSHVQPCRISTVNPLSVCTLLILFDRLVFQNLKYQSVVY